MRGQYTHNYQVLTNARPEGEFARGTGDNVSPPVAVDVDVSGVLREGP